MNASAQVLYPTAYKPSEELQAEAQLQDLQHGAPQEV
jgi:hypothetical protein